MKERIIQFVIVLCSCGILIGLLLPARSGGGPTKNGTARTEIMNLSAALSRYCLDIGQNPTGSRTEILKEISGQNSKRIKFFEAKLNRISRNGELLDPWETPYEIQVLGETNHLIRSAGPNQIFGDKDDLTNSPSTH